MAEALHVQFDDPQEDDPVLHPDHDWKTPNYVPVFAQRQARLAWLRANPAAIPALRAFYVRRPWRFLDDWCMTFDPRLADQGLPSNIPFLLFPRQVEYLQWMRRRIETRTAGLVEKSRDMGASYLAMGLAVCMFCCQPGFVVGLGSRKEDLIDNAGDSKALFFMIRHLLSAVPSELKPPDIQSAHMRVWSSSFGSSIVGEAGDNIGRGGRTSMYIVDEAAFIERQELSDRALSNNTNVRIDISTVNGSGNSFYRKRMRYNNTDRVFVFDWREDPRKDDDWYARKREELDATTVAQEIDRDYNASQDNQFIPGAWVKAAIDAHIRLGFPPTGIRVTGFDPADTGDAKAIVHRWGSVLLHARQMTTGTINEALPWALLEADAFRADVMRYDGDGLGTPVVRQQLAFGAAGRFLLQAFNGGADVEDPDQVYSAVGEETDATERTNKDRFLNLRAQAWTWMHDRFRETYNAIQRAEQGKIVTVDPERLISISSECGELHQLVAELSRPMRRWSPNGKIRVESKAEMRARNVDSPNLADSAVMAFATRRADVGFSRPIPGHTPIYTDPGAGY